MPPREIEPYLCQLDAWLHHTLPLGEAQQSIGLIVPKLQRQKASHAQNRGKKARDGAVGVEPVGPAVEGLAGIVVPHFGHEPGDLSGRDVGGIRDDEVIRARGESLEDAAGEGGRWERGRGGEAVPGHDLEPVAEPVRLCVSHGEVEGRRRTVDCHPRPAGEGMEKGDGDGARSGAEVEEPPGPGARSRSSTASTSDSVSGRGTKTPGSTNSVTS